MNSKVVIIVVLLLVLLGGGFMFFRSRTGSGSNKGPTPTPTEELAEQLPAEKHPKVSLEFTKDARYVNVRITNVHAAQIEYDLIYDATVKNNRIQSGVSASAKTSGETTYQKQQLLGSESSGKFTYHTNIQNAVLNLTLRDERNRSIFTATYPFTVTAGKSVDLVAQ